MHTEHSDYSSSSALHSSYFGVKYLDFIIPIILVIFSSVAAILSLESRSLVYGAVSLAIFFLGLSLFFYLGLTYLAIFQVAVYVGAIAVLIMFTVMVVGEGQGRKRSIPLLGMGL